MIHLAIILEDRFITCLFINTMMSESLRSVLLLISCAI